MTRQRTRTGLGTRRSKLSLQLETLEARRVLSSSSMTLLMDATASHMIGKVATGRVMVLEGQTTPHSSVQMHIGAITKLGHSNNSGHFQFKVSVPSGSYLVKVKARDHAGQISKAEMTVTEGDAVLAWIDTMIQVIKADIANVGLASRTMAMVSAAVYDSVNDIERTGSVFKVDVQAPARRIRFGSGLRGRLHGALGARPEHAAPARRHSGPIAGHCPFSERTR
jgi:hypothetical protein